MKRRRVAASVAALGAVGGSSVAGLSAVVHDGSGQVQPFRRHLAKDQSGSPISCVRGYQEAMLRKGFVLVAVIENRICHPCTFDRDVVDEAII
jgi:hypothetical protein